MNKKIFKVYSILLFFLISCSSGISDPGEDYLFPFKVFDKYGYINQKGEVAIQPQFDSAGRFVDGIAFIYQGRGEREGVIDIKGRIIIPAKYEIISDFNGYEMAPAKLNGKFGYIDKKGNTVLPFIYDFAKSFSEGLAYVKVDRKNYFIDIKGNKLFSFDADTAREFHEGFAVVFKKGKAPVGHDYTYIDRNGKMLTDFIFHEITERAQDFSNGYALVEISYKEKRLIDKNGKYAFPNLNYSPLSAFNEGLAAVYFNDQKKCGYIDPEGKIVIQPQFDGASPFSEGLAAVGILTGNDEYKEGFIDKTGTIVIEPRFYDTKPFVDGMAQVKLEPDKEQWGYINKKGEVVFKAKYEIVKPLLPDFHNGLCSVDIPGTLLYRGYIDKQGKWVFREDEAEKRYRKMPNGDLLFTDIGRRDDKLPVVAKN